MPPDATATKKRLLAAAVREFAEYGLAGARVDRIAESAQANKRSIYMHFGTKEELFERIVADSLLELAEAIPFDAEDLPGYAGKLHDMLRLRPEIPRLTNWALLERPQPIASEMDSYRAKLDAIAVAQRRGAVNGNITPADLLAMILALVMSWSTASASLRALVEAPTQDERIEGHRKAMIAAVAAITEPLRK
jgi:AcrR family transcriptional regulator